MAKRFTDSMKWDDDWFLGLGKEEKLLWIYLLDKCDMAGMFKPNLKLLNFSLDSNYTLENLISIFKDRIQVMEDGKMFIPKFITFQYGHLSTDSPFHKKILKLLKDHSVSTPCQQGVKTLQDKDKVNNNNKERVVKGKQTECLSFLSYYNEKTKKHFRPTKSNLDLINSRLKDGFTVEQLKMAVDNFVKDDWVDRHKYMDLIYCIGKQRGKPDNLERWINWKPAPEKTGIDKWEVRR